MMDEAVVDLARAARFRLGDLEVDPPRRRVSTGETLEPRVMQVLVALARANGAVVGRDELIRTCWDGRIVGEDSITRVVGALRRLAEERGGGSFRIETVPKVGYRLVGDVTPIVAPDGAAAAATGTFGDGVGTLPGTTGAATGSSRRGVLIAAAVATGVVVAAGGWWLTRPGPAAPAVQFTGYRTVGAVPAAVPEQIAAATRSAFTADGLVAVTTAPAPFRLSGTLDRSGDGDAAVVRLAAQIDTAGGTTLWAHSYERPVASANGAKWFASRTTAIARCGASRLAGSPPLSDDALRLIFAECAEESDGVSPFKSLDIARRLTALTPNLASSWATRAYIAYGASLMVPPAEAPAQRAEAVMASDKTLALDPQDARAWQVRAFLHPRTDFVGQERAFLAAIRGHVSDCGCAFVQYGQFLIGVGRAGEARRWFARAHDVAPLHPGPLAALGRLNAQEGRLSEARTNFADLDALSSSPRETARTLVSNAMWTRDYAEAARLLTTDPMPGPPALQAAFVSGMRALASGDAATKARAAAALDAAMTVCHCDTPFPTRLLAALGARDAALRALTSFAAKHPDVATEAVSADPVYAEVRYLPGFAPLARKIGLVDYWRTTRLRPAFCGVTNAPPVCGLLTAA